MNGVTAQTENPKKQIKVPDLPEEFAKDQFRYGVHTTSTVPPFLSTTETIVTEQYNTDPNMMRSTFYVYPSSEYALECSGLPMALVATPFSERGSCNEVSKIDVKTDRCYFCRTYFCCFTIKSDNSYICHMCNNKNNIINPNSTEIPENLRYSSMEAVIDDSSLNSPRNLSRFSSNNNYLMPPVFIFIFDFSFPKCIDFLESIFDLCDNEDFNMLYKKVIFITINDGISLYSINKSGSIDDANNTSNNNTNANGDIVKIRILGHEMPNISRSIAIDISEINIIRKILDDIKKERANLKNIRILGLIEILKNISKTVKGAKVALFSSEKNHEQNYENFIEQTGNIVINVFGEPGSLGSLCFYTGGRMYNYDGNISKLLHNFYVSAVAYTTFNLNLVLKVSNNLSKTGVIAAIYDENFSSTSICGMNSRTAITFLLSLQGLCKDTKYCQLQIFYTGFDGSRKLRILNHSFTTGNPTQFYGGLSMDTLFCVLCKLAISDSTFLIEDSLVKALVFYRKKCCSADTNLTQFILPETLKCLPVLIQTFSKSIYTTANKALIANFDVLQTLRFFYPRLFSLAEFSDLKNTPNLRLSINNLSDSEIYIMENSQTIFVYISRNVDQVLFNQLFTSRNNEFDFVHNTEESMVLASALDQIDTTYGYSLERRIIYSGTSTDETDFLSYMVEDAINNAPDYIDYIFKLHFKVQRG